MKKDPGTPTEFKKFISCAVNSVGVPMLIFFLFSPAYAEPIGFQLTPSSAAMIGIPLEIRGTVRYPAQYALSNDLAGQTTGVFTIKEAAMDPAQTVQGTKTQAVRLIVVPFDLGPQTLAPLPWSLRDASGNPQTILSPPVKIDVAGPTQVPGSNDDIRDIKPPLKPLIWPFILLAFIVVGLLGAAFEKYRPKRGRMSPEISAALQDTRPPHVVALDQLGKLRVADIPAKEFYISLTDILRIYLERQFGIPASVLTSSDLLRQMRQAEIDQRAVGSARKVFDRSDLVKFAKLQPEPQDRQADIEEAIDVVQSTAPPEPAGLQPSSSVPPETGNTR